MKRILQISFVLNIVLLAIVGWRSTREMPMPRTPRGEVRQTDRRSITVRVTSNSPDSTPATSWKTIEDRDPRKFIEKLRAIGCPERTICDIVALRVCREFRSRLIERDAEAAQVWDYRHQQNREYWRERNAQQQDLRDEMITTLESLFDESWQSLAAVVQGAPMSWRDPLESLSAEARRQVREVDSKFRRELNDLQQRRWMGEVNPEDMTTARELERQKRAALANVLSPQEAEEYLYRQSPAADYVRRNLPEAKSEGEFRAMVKLALEMDMSGSLDSHPFNNGIAVPDDVKSELEQRKAEFDQKLKELLGEARVAEQQVEEQARAEAAAKAREAQNELDSRRQLAEMAEKAGVSVEDANRFFDRIKELEPILKPKFDEMEKNFTGTSEEKERRMKSAVQTEFEKIAVETIGEKGRELVKKMIEADSK